MPEEKILTINLRKKLVKVPRWRRVKDQMKFLKELVKQRTKVEKVKIGKSLNEKIWSRGMGKPVTKIRVKIIKEDKQARVELME